MRKVGGQLHLTDDVTFSTSSLINEFGGNFPEKTREYLREFKSKFNSEEIISIFASLRDLKVLIIGDTIFDKYVFCDAMGKEAKEPLLVYNNLDTELYAGGVLAIANHVANFVDKVCLVTSVGLDQKSNSAIKSRLNKNIDTHFFLDKTNPSLTKLRYIEKYWNRKVFEIYESMYHNIDADLEKQIIKYLDENLELFDVVIVSDFGHGMITDRIQECTIRNGNFIAANAQTNSGNFGYNFITKYKNVDFVSLNDLELKLALRENGSDFGLLIQRLSKSIGCHKINLTLGKKGVLYLEDNIRYSAPIFSYAVIDTVGAGDAILSIVSLLAYRGVNPKIIPFVANCIGALAVKIMGNKESINPIDLNKFISYILR